jgi:uncharacterized NAD(P)/FAD-binding protein YdhS
MNRDVTVVGGGAAGLLTAIHLLRRGDAALHITLVEKSAQVGNGIAYATRRSEHLLNVTAGRMSAFDDDPDHFVRYLRTHENDEINDRANLASTFARRRQYSDYLRETFEQTRKASAATVEILRDEVVKIDDVENTTLTLRSGRTLACSQVVLALGNWPRANALASDASLPTNRVLQGWNFESVADIGKDETIVIAGSGLSMVDAALTLASNGHAGRIHVVSRHGFFPLPHAVHGHIDIDLDAFAKMPLTHRVRELRRFAREAQRAGKPWQWVMDTLRTHNAELWQTLSASDQRRFLRIVARYWDVHRHRIPPSAATTLDTLLESGQMKKHKGRVGSVAWRDNRLDVQIADSAGRHSAAISADRIIDCTGLQGDIRRVRDPLIMFLLERGLIRQGAHGIGIDTDPHGAIVARDGKINPHLYTLGSARIGQLWESIAVPELRLQADAVARKIFEQRRA